jgi:hypothetical protein
MKCPRPTGDIRGPRITDQCSENYVHAVCLRFNPCEQALIIIGQPNEICSRREQRRLSVSLEWMCYRTPLVRNKLNRCNGH